MTRVPTLYIRNVPPQVYDALKARAKREGRSVNAEALKILEDVAAREARPGSALTDRLWELSKHIKRMPGDPTGAEVIRLLRDGREEELDRRLRGDRD